MEGEIFDTIIIGGGPAGCAAAVYTARKSLKTLLITQAFGGQSIMSDDIQNWIGEVHISGLDLAKKLEAHVRAYPNILTVKSPEKAIGLETVQCPPGEIRFCDFKVKTDKGEYIGKSIILAAGARHRKLQVPGEDRYENKGISYCSTCDAPLFAGKKVAVVGGGNSGLEAVQDLFPYATEIYLLEMGNSIRGDVSTLEETKKHPKLKEIILNAQTLEIIGETLVTGIKFKDLVSGTQNLLKVNGVFIAVGSVPNSEFVKNVVQLDAHGQVMVNIKNAATSHPGIFAAGDVTDDPYKQNNIAVGDGVRAGLSAYQYLLNRQKKSPAEEGSDNLQNA
ncbi:FAD-dependent oxidoreductase [Candidatus Daviesbacteria bacterium]|nr:FAD-dependent oxidoreductase [Candidatus Daviesbacteria bacterium]